MACTIQQFKDRKVKEAVSLLYNEKSPAYKLFPKTNPNSIIITPTSKSKIKTQEQAYNAAVSMMKKLEKEYGETYEFNTFGHWGTIYNGLNDVRIEVKIPKNLERAYQIKQEQESRGIEYFNSDTALYEQEQRETQSFFDMPKAQTQPEPIDFERYVTFKQNMLKDTQKTLQSLKALRVHDKTRELASKIRKLENIETQLNQDIAELLNEETVLGQILAYMAEDLALIDELLDSGTIDNMHTAELMLGFYDSISDITRKNIKNPMVNVRDIYDKNGKLTISPDIEEVFNKLREQVTKKVDRLTTKKEKYLQDLIDNSSHIQALFPEMDIEELLKEIEDIDVASQFFLTIDKQYMSSDSLLSQLMKIELERARSNSKSFVTNIKKRMDAILPAVKKKLPKIARIPYWFGKSFIENDWSIFYQQTGRGNKTGRIVDKFSTHWFKTYNNAMSKLNGDYFEAMRAKKYDDANEALEKKYNWLNNHTDFIDITQLPEVVNDPRFERYLQGIDTSGAAQYSAMLKNKLGENYYNKVIQAQMQQLQDFLDSQEDYLEEVLNMHNVTKFEDLPDVMKFNVVIRFLRNNPFEFIKSHKSGQQGRVDYVSGNSSKQYQSNIKYIEYIPKEQIRSYNVSTGQTGMKNSNYYDENFKKIEEDSDLFKFWEILEEATTFMNMTLADSEKYLKHGSVLSMKQSMWDILIDPKSGIGNKFINLSSELKNSLKSLFTSKGDRKVADDFDDISKSQFKTNEEAIKQRKDIIKLKMGRIMEDYDITDKVINLAIVPQKFLDAFGKELGLPTDRNKMMNELGSSIIRPWEVMDEYVTELVMQEQTLNLPVLLRAYLEMTAEYKAQKESQPTLAIYKQFYDSIERKSTNSKYENSPVTRAMRSITGGGGEGRARAKKRLSNWYNKNVLGNRDKNNWAVLGKPDWLSYDKYELQLKKEIEARLADPNIGEKERNKLEKELENLGANVTLSAIYNSVVNRYHIWKGLAYSVKSNVINRFQGLFQGIFHDTGKFATAGNFTIANNFIFRKGLRHIPGNSAYANSINITKLLINELGILQDATNEIDRARNESGLTGIAKKVQPFYLTEYTEWHNQTPQILGMLMDKTIEDRDGNKVPIFTGNSFPAYEIKDGLLKLKEEFRYDSNGNENTKNIETWEKFSNIEASDNKLYMSEVIGIINGDYSRTGSTYVKSTDIGKTAMMFKTWMPNNIWTRISKKQPQLILGKEGVESVYSSHRPLTLGATLGTLGFLTAGFPIGLIAGGVGVATSLAIAKAQNRDIRYDMQGLARLADTGQGILKKMIGMPVNLVSGKQIIKDHKYSKTAVSEQDAQNLSSIATEMGVLLTFVLFKVLIKSMLGPNDEEEPKTVLGGKAPNPYYPGDPQSEREKQMHNVLENEVTRIIDDLALYENPINFYNSTIQRNTLYQIFENIKSLNEAVQKWNQGLDEIQTGPNQGESRLWNTTKQTFLPSIIASPFTLGYESSMEREYNTSEYFDSYFWSDYKKDKKLGRNSRTGTRAELKKEYRDAYGWDELEPADQVIIDDIIDKQLNKIMNDVDPMPDRIFYDENQKLIE